MSYDHIIKPEAESDLEEAADWYDGQSRGLGIEFLQAAREAVQRICQNPNGYAPIYRGIRAEMLRRFPYVVYFEFQEDIVAVLAIMHGGRDPSVWQSRVDESG